jgi:hypothetical protein
MHTLPKMHKRLQNEPKIRKFHRMHPLRSMPLQMWFWRTTSVKLHAYLFLIHGRNHFVIHGLNHFVILVLDTGILPNNLLLQLQNQFLT